MVKVESGVVPTDSNGQRVQPAELTFEIETASSTKLGEIANAVSGVLALSPRRWNIKERKRLAKYGRLTVRVREPVKVQLSEIRILHIDDGIFVLSMTHSYGGTVLFVLGLLLLPLGLLPGIICFLVAGYRAATKDAERTPIFQAFVKRQLATILSAAAVDSQRQEV